ncbi:uncharacterized protein LOC134253755 [Saccostrea cucullata]|uniref:uncharacterized protein LOC134253755 n=1 Tax=Saccostrea cuccullata TaxID=36930 RepID=UPI002ED11B24
MNDNLCIGENLSWLKTTVAPLLCILFTFKGILATHNNGFKLLSLLSSGSLTKIVCSAIVLKVLFDMVCLILNVSFVRRKVFKPYKTKKLTLIVTVFMTFSTADCPEGLFRHDGQNGTIVCCKGVTCSPGSYVRTCSVNKTEDTCLPCPSKSYLLDSTNSGFPVPCFEVNCPPEAAFSTTFPKTGCRLRCRCDSSRGFIGHDPCNCKRVVQVNETKQRKQPEEDHQRFSCAFNTIQKPIVLVTITTGLIILVWCLYLLHDRLYHGHRMHEQNV